MGARILSLLLAFLLAACSSLLYQPAPAHFIDATKLDPQPVDHYFEGADGKKLHAWLFKNRLNKKKPSAVILFFHGNAQNLSTHFHSLYWILNEDIDYLIFDYQGYGRSVGRPTPQNTVQDGQAALAYLQTLYPESKLVVFGQSIGSNIAARVLIENQQKIKVALAVLDSAFDSYQGAGQDVLAKNWITWPFQWLPYVLLSDRWAASDKITQYPAVPTLFFHGTSDPVIRLERGQRLFAKLPAPKSFYSVEGAPHIGSLYRSEEARKRLLAAIKNPDLISE